ncbi:MAG: acetyl-CoA carboxylase biotin carboxyl carrier protein [Planctomycetota bacterium]
MNDLKTIRQLIKMMVDNDLTEIDLEGEGEKVKLKRGGPVGPASAVQFPPAPVAAPAAAPASAPPAEAGDADSDADGDLVTIDSPMVGTFYTASSPDADAFVSVGDTVKADSTVVCIVEAMKVFNEIKADVSGKIVEVLVETGQAVEFGQPMFRIKP